MSAFVYFYSKLFQFGFNRVIDRSLEEREFKGCGLICSMQAYSLEKIVKQLQPGMIDLQHIVDKQRYLIINFYETVCIKIVIDQQCSP